MKLALIGAAAVAAATFATPALAQAVVEDPGYCAQPNAKCQNPGPQDPYTGDTGYYREWQNSNANAIALQRVVEPDAHRYHGGPKDND